MGALIKAVDSSATATLPKIVTLTRAAPPKSILLVIRLADTPRQIPRPVGEDTGRRDDVINGGEITARLKPCSFHYTATL
jgi:hypothetical protein